jgi:hypothetical protein
MIREAGGSGASHAGCAGRRRGYGRPHPAGIPGVLEGGRGLRRGFAGGRQLADPLPMRRHAEPIAVAPTGRLRRTAVSQFLCGG